MTDVAYSCVPPGDVALGFAFVLFQALGLDELGKGIKPGLSRSDAYALPVNIPPLAEQHRIVAKVDELMALCDRLEAEQADAEAAHAKLVEALLASLTRARNAADFRASWQQLAEHFHTLFTTETSIEALKQAVLQLGVMGKLAPQDASEGTALELLRDIEDAKSRAVEFLPRRSVRTVRRSDDSFEEPYSLPPSWTWVTAEPISSEIVDCPHSTPKFVSAGVLCLDTNSIKRGSLLTHKLRATLIKSALPG